MRFYPHTQPCASTVCLLFSKYVEILFYFLAISQILLGLYLIGLGVQWLGYARRRMHTDPGFYSPKVAVLCPCRGIEAALERNLVSLTEFDYQNYEIFFLIASASDPAYNIVKRVVSSSRAKAHVVITDKPDGCGEKVNNLRLGIMQLDGEFEVLTFVDSDGRPGKNWLHRMVAPLADSRIGATTTMRWLIPNRSNLATALLAAWNAPIVTMLSEKGKNFCWGGGTAIRRSVFDQSGVVEEWQHSVSDDYSMTRALERANRSIVFLPECIVPSFVETDFAGLMEFTNRQVLITRVYAEKIWAMAAGTHLLYCLSLALGTMLTLSDFLATRPAFHLAALTFLPVLLSMIRGALRAAGVSEVLPAYRSQIAGQAWIYVLLTVFIPFLYLANFISSLVTRKIRWRGITYELIAPGQTRIISY
ncbi:MAG TPA: glycosyltransferase family 2 protein [Candidatus Acidoferrum sp.]|nr:glycosyltransferase family 2 protein [Candidatus Acidoferrum sp.]